MCIKYIVVSQWGFSSSSVGKEFACNAGDCLQHWRPGLGRFPREGNGNPLQYSCLGIPWDRRAWWATVCGVARVGHNLVTKPLPPVTQWVACWVEFVSSFRYMGFPGVSDSKKKSACTARDLSLIFGLGRFPGEGIGYPFQYSYLENPHGQRNLVGYSPWGCRVRYD